MHEVMSMWLPLMVLIAIGDSIVAAGAIAVVIDRQLMSERVQWHFGLKTLLAATALIAMHVAAIASFVFYKT
jgi:hypothetical protein